MKKVRELKLLSYEKCNLWKSKIILLLKDMDNSFCVVMILGFLFTLCTLLVSDENYYMELFFHDTLDSGMDFFHSIEYTKGRAPYDLFNTLYPPLANLFFYFLYCLVPMSVSAKWPDTFSEGIKIRGTETDMRVQQSTMLLFVIFILIIAACMVLLVRKILSEHKRAELVAICTLLSYGMLCSFERGNIIVLSLLCSMVFVFYKDSENKIIRELALVALAVAAGLKIYPALFGVLLLYDKQYKEAIRTVIYGIIFFVLPVFAFKEGLSGIPKFLNILFKHTGGGEFTFSAKGLSFDRIMNYVLYFFDRIFKCGINMELAQNVFPRLNLVVLVILLLCGLFLNKRWEKVLACSLAFILFQNQWLYILIFLLIPLIAMIKEEKSISTNNVVPFVALVFSVIVLPASNPRYEVYTAMYGRIQMMLITLTVYILISVIPNVKNFASTLKKTGNKGNSLDKRSVDITIEKNVLEKISNSNNSLLIALKKMYAFATNPTTSTLINKEGKKVYLLLSPQYNNLGDHAIALASIQILKEAFVGYEIIEITSNFYKNFKESFMNGVTKEDVLVIIGGGFMGDLWLTMENMVRDIISSFKENKIIILPQTIYFDSKEEQVKSKGIYRSHNDLHIMVRDRRSYLLCKNELEVKSVYFLPDIVTVLGYKNEVQKGQKVGICLRTDKENMKYDLSVEEIEETVKKMGYLCVACSTLIKIPYISTSQREKFVKRKIAELGSFQFIITNRLHCMIFAYLSKTPCIAFDNKSKKVSGVYEWIKECKYIKLYDSGIELQKQITEVMNGLKCDDEALSVKLRACFDDAFKKIR